MSIQPSTDAVWTALSADLRRFIRRRVADDHVADDLLQETFVRIHRRIDALSDENRLAAWVYRIARNVVNDHYRRDAAAAVPLAEIHVAEEADPLAPLRAGASVWLEELVRQLPETYREAVQLAEIDGLSQQQVAERLGLSLSAAKSRVHRGRAQLKQVLDRCCDFRFDRRGNLVDIDPKPDRTVCRDCGDFDTPGGTCG